MTDQFLIINQIILITNVLVEITEDCSSSFQLNGAIQPKLNNLDSFQ